MKLCQTCDKKYPSHTIHCETGNCGALLIPIEELDPGTRVGKKFRILETLGSGGFGTVYLAEQLLNPSAPRRALKFPHSNVVRDAHSFTRFQQEAALNLIHPNIVHVYDLDQADDGSYYFPMEYVPGCELRDLIATGPFAVERALAMAHGIAEGLKAAHAKNIVHRDIKPENIRVANPAGPNEVPKLLDFGMAAFKESNSGVSTNRGAGFSMPYAAPEQWRGQRGQQLDGRTDLYALGGVLYEMLTGSNPFHIDPLSDYSEWSYQHLQGQRIAASAFRPELLQWPGLDELLLHTLAIDREDRPADAAEFLGYLEDVQLRRPPHKPWRPIGAPRLTVRTGPNVRIDTVVIPTGPGQTYPGPALPVPSGPPPIYTGPSSIQTGPPEPPSLMFGGNAEETPAPDRKPLFLVGAIVLVVLAAGGLGLRGYLNLQRTKENAKTIQDLNADAMLHENTGDNATAIDDFQKILAIDPQNEDAKRGLAALMGVTPVPKATIAVSCNVACAWKLDRVSQGQLAAGVSTSVQVAPGPHAVVAEAADGNLPAQQRTANTVSGETYQASFQFKQDTDANTPPLCPGNRAMTLNQVVAYLTAKLPESRTAALIHGCGVNFPLDALATEKLHRAGASQSVMAAVRAVAPQAPQPPIQPPIEPGPIPGLLQQAKDKYNSGDNCGAIALYNQVLRLQPNNPTALNGREEAQKEQKILGPCESGN